jgi:cytoskeletal protein CcmA (bactofilin family)
LIRKRTGPMEEPAMKGIVFLAVLLASLSPTALAQQTELGGKVRSGQEVVVASGETVQGDLIASAGTVRIDGRVDGDLLATGGRVTVAGTVTGDVMAAGGSTTISGQVDGDARLASGQVRVEGRVGEDLVIGAGQATVASGAQVGGDLIFGAGQVQMDGTVAGSVLGSTGSYTRGGSVAGSERVSVQQREEQAPTAADRTLGLLRRYVSVLVVGLLLLWLAPRVLRGAAEAVRRRPLASFGIGIVGVIGVAVGLVVVLFVTILLAIGLGLLGLGPLAGTIVFAGILAIGIIAFLLFLAVTFGAPAAVGLGLGRLLFREGGSFARAFAALALGVLVVVLIAAIPLVGGWLQLLLVLLGLGALLLGLSSRSRRLAEQPG